MNTFVCKCGQSFKEREEPKNSLGLLKSLSSQVELEAYQAKNLAEFIKLKKADNREKWITEMIGPEYPKDSTVEEIIEDYLYKSNRHDGFSATFLCPFCGRLSILNNVNEEWQTFIPER